MQDGNWKMLCRNDGKEGCEMETSGKNAGISQDNLDKLTLSFRFKMWYGMHGGIWPRNDLCKCTTLT